MKPFIKIQETRLRTAAIKQYKPFGETKLQIFYTASRYKVDLDTYTFDSEKERDKVIEELDANFLS